MTELKAGREMLACPLCGARINEYCRNGDRNIRHPHLVRTLYVKSVRAFMFLRAAVSQGSPK